MKDISFFQIGVIGVFIFFIIFAVLIFSGVIPWLSSSNAGGGTVTVWGSVPKDTFMTAVTGTKAFSSNKITISYTAIPSATFESQLVSALARGEGPDIIILPHTLVYQHADKITPISYETVSAREYQDTFVSEGNLFQVGNGILALPLYVDPVVMYVNNDSLTSAGYAKVPTLWSQFVDASSGRSVVQALTTVSAQGVVEKSALALGDFSNVDHAKDILSLLLLQAGSSIVTTQEGSTKYISDLGSDSSQAISPAVSALNFFTQFASRGRTTYTWSGTLPRSKNAFSSGMLAVYLGLASELPELREKNPHLNFDMALVPQRGTGKSITYGNLYGVARLRRSANPTLALVTVQLLTAKEFSSTLAGSLSVASARRDVLATNSTDALRAIIDQSALISRGWLDPSPKETETIFGTMVQSTVVGSMESGSAVSRAHQELSLLLK